MALLVLNHFLPCRQCLNKTARFIPNRFYSNSKPKSAQTFYDILGVKPSATAKEIRDAFVRLSKEIHPDKNPNDPENHRKFVKLNEAYTVLSKPLTRREYDISLVAKFYQQQNVTTNAFGGHKSGYSAGPGDAPRYDTDAQQTQFWDETIFHMRNRSKDAKAFYEEDNYYGIKGIKRLPNSYIAIGGCLILLTLGHLYFYFGYRYAKARSIEFNEKEKRLSLHLDEVRTKARMRSNASHLQNMQKNNQKLLNKEDPLSSQLSSPASSSEDHFTNSSLNNVQSSVGQASDKQSTIQLNKIDRSSTES